MPFREAVGVSLVCVIVTSSAAAGVYLERHLANLRLGMLLEVFTATGALLGGLVAFALPERVLAGLFAALLAYTAFSMLRARPGPGGGHRGSARPTRSRDRAAAAAGCGRPGAPVAAWPTRSPGPGTGPGAWGRAPAGAWAPGMISALLGVGGGIVKVPLMHLVMGVPLKVATATSNLMIGVTAAASAIVYLAAGRDRPVRGRADGGRRLRGRDGRLAPGGPDRRPRSCGSSSSASWP